MSTPKLLKRFAVGLDVRLLKLKHGSEVQISGKELRHLKASRVSVGDKIEVFDKHEGFALAQVKQMDAGKSLLSILETSRANTNNQTLLTLAVGMPKGNRSDWLVEKVTEVGISNLIPLETDRTLLKVKDPKMERWERLMNQAAKQSITQTPPVLRECMDMEELLNDEVPNYDAILWGCMPQDVQFKPRNLLEINSTMFDKKPSNALLIIGPEGDLSFDEKKKLESIAAIPVILSANRLRVETAAIVFVATSALIFREFR